MTTPIRRTSRAAAASAVAPTRAPSAVIALGDAFMGDDGFGATTLAMLESHWQWPPTVDLVDAGRAPVDLAMQLAGRARVLLLATVRADMAAGTVVSWQRRAVLDASAPLDAGVRDVLLEAVGDGLLDDLLLIGVVPFTTAPGAPLTPLVEVACRIAAVDVVRRARGWGVAVEGRAAPGARAWWKTATV